MRPEETPGTAGPPPGARSQSAPLIERAPLPLVEVRGSAHTVSFANAAFCRLLGKSRGELIGKTFAEIVPEGSACASTLARVYEAGQAAPAHAREDSLEAALADWLYALWPALDPKESPVGIIVLLARSATFHEKAAAANEALLIAGLRQHELNADAENLNALLKKEIAEREVAEKALHAAIVDLESAREVADRASRAKDGFLAALSHELRTPLTPVLMAAAALREDERIPADARDQLGMMERNIALEARLIDDLLDLTKISQGKLQYHAQPCDAHHLIGRAIEIVQDDARARQLTIERAFDAQNSRLLADPARFQQVIWNLLRNAVKFTPRGGRIGVTTRDGKRMPNGDTWLHIEVTDTGIGIAAAQLDQIFEPFDQGGLTGDHRFGGVGLGLAIARAVVVLHGGRILAQSPGVNRGATFIVELPGATAAPSGIAVTSASPGAGSNEAATRRTVAPLRLLLVEDHENTLQTMCRLLQREGHHVVTAPTVADALLAAAAPAAAFDLVISDLGLPDGSGNELMEKLRDRYGLRGLALSGYGAEEDIARSRSAGFVTHLVKPVAIGDLRRAIASFAAGQT